jgi:hypothetical protein
VIELFDIEIKYKNSWQILIDFKFIEPFIPCNDNVIKLVLRFFIKMRFLAVCLYYGICVIRFTEFRHCKVEDKPIACSSVNHEQSILQQAYHNINLSTGDK